MTAARLRMTNVLLALVLLALLAIIGMLATGVRGGPLDPGGAPGSTPAVRLPGTPISSPTTISQPGHYYLTNDISVAGNVNAIVISASNVSLDLGGFTIDGTDTNGSQGILITENDVTVSNGTVKDFHVGVKNTGMERARIEDVHAVSNIRGMEIGWKSVITGCVVMDNSESGIVILSSRSVVRYCTVLENAQDGISVFGIENLIERSMLLDSLNGWDINSIGSVNTIRDNYVQEIRLVGDANVVMDNVCGQFTTNIIDAAPLYSLIAAPTDPHGNVDCGVVQE